MKLEYLNDITGGGKHPNVWPTKLIRLFDFDEQQNQQLIKLLSEKLLGRHVEMELADIDFIVPLNCRLLLRLSTFDKGIVKLNGLNSFAFDLTEAGYRAVINAMCNTGDGYNWLTDDFNSDEDVEFLYSAGGSW